MATQHCMVRLRLTDGSIVHAASYLCRDGVLIADSDSFGEIQLRLEDLSEIILDPAPIRPPKEPAPKRPIDTAEASERTDSKPEEKK